LENPGLQDSKVLIIPQAGYIKPNQELAMLVIVFIVQVISLGAEEGIIPGKELEGVASGAEFKTKGNIRAGIIGLVFSKQPCKTICAG
jgi:hypothetical protein